MFAFFGCNKAHGNPKMSTSHSQIVSVRGVLSHACLRKANWDIGMVTGFCHPPGIADKFVPFNQFTPSLIERIGRKGALEATIETPDGVIQVVKTHLHMGKRFFARNIRVKQLKSILERMKGQLHLPVILAGDFNENVLMEQKKFVNI